MECLSYAVVHDGVCDADNPLLFLHCPQLSSIVLLLLPLPMKFHSRKKIDIYINPLQHGGIKLLKLKYPVISGN